MYTSETINIFTSSLSEEKTDPRYEYNILLRELRKSDDKVRDFQLCDDISMADFYLLPMDWRYYVDNGLTFLAINDIEQKKGKNIPTIVFNPSDFPANIPTSGVIVLETAGYHSQNTQNGNSIFGLPAFTGDYLSTYCEGVIIQSPFREIPLIGFCGQASTHWFEYLYRETRRKIRKISYTLGFNKLNPPPFETVKFRGDILHKLEVSKLVDTNFLIRRQYRAGYLAEKKDPKHHTRMEFIKNMLDTDYTVCMRGGGNYSVRFYEALSLGRIPVFVNTDCLLPFDDQIKYKDYFVWVDQNEIGRMDKIIVDFHNQSTPNGIIDVQRKCRELWKTYFTVEGFFKNFAHQLRNRNF